MVNDAIELVITVENDTYTISATVDEGTGATPIPGVTADGTGKVVIDVTGYSAGDVITLTAVCDSDSDKQITKSYLVV